MPIGELLVRATAWLGLLGWAAAEWMKATPAARAARAAFTAGGLVMLAHTALALHVRYGWSHEAAALETARQTRAVTGLAFDHGLLVNEVFLVVWLVEALWWWRDARGYRARGRALEWAARAFFFMMFASGAFVFVPGPMRVLGLTALVAVLAAWYRAAKGEPPEVAHG